MVFRSGVPSIFVPHTVFDQHYWAMLAEELGCTTAAIPFPDLTAERLTNAISAILTNPSFRKTAADLGENIRQEKGEEQARLLIEQLVRKIGSRKGEDSVGQRLSRQAEVREERANRRKEFLRGGRSRRVDVS